MDMVIRKHLLKMHSPFFELLLSGRKRFEIRRNDRDFRHGDMVEVWEVEPVGGGEYAATGMRAEYKIGHMSDFGQRDGFVVWQVEGLRKMPSVEVRS